MNLTDKVSVRPKSWKSVLCCCEIDNNCNDLKNLKEAKNLNQEIYQVEIIIFSNKLTARYGLKVTNII